MESDALRNSRDQTKMTPTMVIRTTPSHEKRSVNSVLNESSRLSALAARSARNSAAGASTKMMQHSAASDPLPQNSYWSCTLLNCGAATKGGR